MAATEDKIVREFRHMLLWPLQLRRLGRASEHAHPWEALRAQPGPWQPVKDNLLVDDDSETLSALTEMLENIGAHVISASSAAEALRAAQEAGPQVVVSDLGMPGMDGYGLMRAIRALPIAAHATVPAIALTASAGADVRARSLAAGFQEHLEKPIDLDRLAHAIVDASLLPRRSA